MPPWSCLPCGIYVGEKQNLFEYDCVHNHVDEKTSMYQQWYQYGIYQVEMVIVIGEQIWGALIDC